MDAFEHGMASPTESESTPSIIAALKAHSKSKPRSSITHDTDHAPLLIPKGAPPQPITCLLLGHSFFERFKTTGRNTCFGPTNATFPEYFNAGVGGDKISNVMYRLVDKGLLFSLQQHGVECALLAMGTNDLIDDRRPLSKRHVEQYELVIQALQWACPRVKILVCGIAPRRRVKKAGIVEESNALLEDMVRRFSEGEFGDAATAIEWLPSDPQLVDNLEPDGVHLNEQGYDMFAESLWAGYQALKCKIET